MFSYYRMSKIILLLEILKMSTKYNIISILSQMSKMILILQIVYQILSVYPSRLILNIDFSRH